MAWSPTYWLTTVKMQLMELGDPRIEHLQPRPAPDRPSQGEAEGDATIGDSILARAHRTVAQAERLVERGEGASARPTLQQLARDLRAHAPSSGRPEALMELSHAVAQLAESV